MGLRLVEYPQRVSQLSRLEQQPALLNLDHCRQLVRANRLHQLASPDDMFLRLLVFTLLAMRTPLPEMCNRRQPLIAQFAFRLQHELQYVDCPPQVFLTECAKRFRHSQLKKFWNSHARAMLQQKPVRHDHQGLCVAIAKIHPLRQSHYNCPGVGFGRF